jgi:hypothetical protein
VRFARAIIPAVCLLLTGCIAVAAAIQHTTRLDEAVIAESSRIRLKVVRYREYHPFVIIGYSYLVECASAETKRFARVSDYQDRGWRTITSGNDHESRSAAAIAKRLQPAFRILDGDVVQWTSEDGRIYLSNDGCVTFTRDPRAAQSIRTPESARARTPYRDARADVSSRPGRRRC